ncbi:MAG: s-methyl-5-thioribose-1-phosphate isomerase [Eubacteriales bacterium]
MYRADQDLAFMLQYENVAWYEKGKVRILDRRVYPARVEFVECSTHQEVMGAIRDMVTQSAGPYTAAGMGMALAAYECRTMSHEGQLAYLADASHTIANARPTTATRMKLITESCREAIQIALASGKDGSEAAVVRTVEMNNSRYDKIGKIAEYLVDMFPKKGNIMTQCFGETIVGQMCKVAKGRGYELSFYCPETRPYFQGARLTASVIHDQGFPVTVITDNMPAWVMKTEKIDAFTSAADAICLDGHVVNKVGTFQIALVANGMGVPYFATGAPDPGHPTIDTVHIEMRDPDFVLQAMGVRTAMDGVSGYYPSFDVTPPHLVSAVVTDDGAYSPYDLHRYFKSGNVGEY